MAIINFNNYSRKNGFIYMNLEGPPKHGSSKPDWKCSKCGHLNPYSANKCKCGHGKGQ